MVTHTRTIQKSVVTGATALVVLFEVELADCFDDAGEKALDKARLDVADAIRGSVPLPPGVVLATLTESELPLTPEALEADPTDGFLSVHEIGYRLDGYATILLPNGNRLMVTETGIALDNGQTLQSLDYDAL